MSAKSKKTKTKPKTIAKPTKASASTGSSFWPFLLPVLALTFIVYLPVFQNDFTNWDDVVYVTENPLLLNLNFEGLKAIFTTPVVSNYHPLTILSLALNYQISELSPGSYVFTNILLHLLNTGLVFWFIRLLSNRNNWISAGVALLFAIHPMHVESVAWVSERKDLLYTLFYIGAMITYIKYVNTAQIKWLIYCTVLGALSLLSKPAAIVLPLSLLLIDYFLKRPWSIKWIVEKIPLFILCAIMAYVTVEIQSKRAIAAVDAHSFLERICYAGFGWVWYLLKIIVPYPLSALHPFPNELSIWYYVATAGALLFAGYALTKIRNRNFLFGFGFYTVNLLLVLQIVSIGNAVVAERYTYVPYIGIFFWMGTVIYDWLKQKQPSIQKSTLIGLGIIMLVFAGLAFQRIGVWKSSQSLWQNVLDTYPDSKRAWTNKGLDLYNQKKYPETIDHLTRALALDPNYVDAIEWRSRAYLDMQDGANAMKDALLFAKLKPNSEDALFLLARSYEATGQSEEAVNQYSQLIAQYNKPEYHNNRGVIYFNKLQRFQEAKADFENAIRLKPNDGSYIMNLSRCYYMMGDIANAAKFAAQARDLGEPLDPAYGKVIGIQ